jgi:hypothetical protein
MGRARHRCGGTLMEAFLIIAMAVVVIAIVVGSLATTQ